MVYILKAGRRFKIGITSGSIDKRVKVLQTGCPDKIEVIHTFITNNSYIVEQEIHKAYKDKNTSGEWFELDNLDVNDIKDFMPTFDKTIMSQEETYNEGKEKECIPKYKKGDIIEYKIESTEKGKSRTGIKKITRINTSYGIVGYEVDSAWVIYEEDVLRLMNELKGTIRKIVYW